LGQAFFQLTDIDGSVIARSTNLGDHQLPIKKEDISRLLADDVLFSLVDRSSLPASGDPEAKNYRLIKYLVKIPNTSLTVLMVAVPMTLFEKETKGLLAFLTIFAPFVLVSSALGGWFFSGSALNPIKHIVAKARSINPSNLAERLPVPSVDDEVRQLSSTLNDLLERIQKAFDSQERFIADVSHEMKTPLAILRGELDLVKEKSDSPEVKSYLDSAEQEIAQISELVQNLLLLARVDAGVSCLSQSAVRIDEMVLDTTASVEPLAKSAGKRISINFVENSDKSGQFLVKGDSGLLQCLTKNLIENAIKYSNCEDIIDLEVVDEESSVILFVKDKGRGIPDTEKLRIFERFYRGESVRGETRGSGLGLHLAERIADIHGGHISVDSEFGRGTTFRVELPKPPASA
jgi:signal transduction histidine kinase